MTINYDRQRCHVFVDKARKLFNDADFVRLWSLFIFVVPYLDANHRERVLNDLELVTSLEGEKQLILFMLREWTKLSLWEIQSVLYMFKPYVAEVARRNAWAVLQHARKKEPL